MSFTLECFIGVVTGVAQEKNQIQLVASLKGLGPECRLFENGHLDSFGMVEFVLALEEKLAPIFGVAKVCIPDYELEYGQKVSDLYLIICKLQGVTPNFVQVLEVA